MTGSGKNKSSNPSRWNWLATLLGVALFLAAVWSLQHTFANHSFGEISDEFRSRSRAQLILAICLTAFSYFVFTGYDLLGLRYLRRKLPMGRAMLTSYLGFTFANNLGFFGGAGLRLRFYLALGLTSVDIAKLIAFSAITFWLGFTALGGVLFIAFPLHPSPDSWLTAGAVRIFGIILIGIFVIYMGLGLEKLREFNFRERRFILPSWRIRLGQVVISSIDWALAATVLYVLLPQTASVHFPDFLAAFLFAQILALASHVPGGLGIFETVILYVLPEQAKEEGGVLASLVLFRLIYYIGPLAIATVVTGFLELIGHHRILAEKP